MNKGKEFSSNQLKKWSKKPIKRHQKWGCWSDLRSTVLFGIWGRSSGLRSMHGNQTMWMSWNTHHGKTDLDSWTKKCQLIPLQKAFVWWVIKAGRLIIYFLSGMFSTIYSLINLIAIWSLLNNKNTFKWAFLWQTNWFLFKRGSWFYFFLLKNGML